MKTETEAGPGNTVVTKDVKVTNPFTIMLEVSKACYVEEVLFGQASSSQRLEISEFVESVGRLDAKELADHVNKHMAMRMFLVGENITAADVIVFAALAPYFSQLSADEKFAMPNAFRWIDHIQHLPGMYEQVQAK